MYKFKEFLAMVDHDNLLHKLLKLTDNEHNEVYVNVISLTKNLVLSDIAYDFLAIDDKGTVYFCTLAGFASTMSEGVDGNYECVCTHAIDEVVEAHELPGYMDKMFSLRNVTTDNGINLTLEKVLEINGSDMYLASVENMGGNIAIIDSKGYVVCYVSRPNSGTMSITTGGYNLVTRKQDA